MGVGLFEISWVALANPQLMVSKRYHNRSLAGDVGTALFNFIVVDRDVFSITPPITATPAFPHDISDCSPTLAPDWRRFVRYLS
jgi:hypothetical protein